MTEREGDNGAEGQGGLKPAMDPAEARRILDGPESSNIERATAATHQETAAVSHGAYMQGRMRCDLCACREICPHFVEGAECELEAAYSSERRRQLSGALRECGHDVELHAPLISQVIVAEMMRDRVLRFVDAMGMLLPKAAERGIVQVQPAVALVPQLQREARGALEALNLTPAALAKLEADREGTGAVEMARMMARVEEQERRAREGAVDAEFEAAPEAPPVASDELRVASDGETGTAESAVAKAMADRQDGQDGRQEQDREDDDGREAGDDGDDAET